MEKDYKQNKGASNPYQKSGIVSIIFLICLTAFIVSLIFFKNKSFGTPLIWTTGILTALNLFIYSGIQEECKGYCERCGRKLKAKEFIYVKGKVSTSEKQAKQSVCFTAVCLGCGKNKKFDEEFKVAEIDSNGWERKYSVDEQAQRYIDKLCK